MLTVGMVQSGNIPMNCLSTKLTKFPPLPEINTFALLYRYNSLAMHHDTWNMEKEWKQHGTSCSAVGLSAPMNLPVIHRNDVEQASKRATGGEGDGDHSVVQTKRPSSVNTHPHTGSAAECMCTEHNNFSDFCLNSSPSTFSAVHCFSP